MSGKPTKWRVGDMARYVSHSCPRHLILEVNERPDYYGRQSYCCMNDSGVICYHSDEDLLTLPEWLQWLEKFRDDLTGKEIRDFAENARREFVPPDWWEAAVVTAMEPFTAGGDTP